MFAALRSPPSTRASMEGTEKAQEKSPVTTSSTPPGRAGFVRRRSGELESMSIATRSPPTTAATAVKQLVKSTTRVKPTTFTIPTTSSTALRAKVPIAEGTNRMVEARNKIRETKKRMDDYFHMKREVKAAINECFDLLLKLLREAEDDKEGKQGGKSDVLKDVECISEPVTNGNRMKEEQKMIEIIEGHGRLLKRNMEEMERLRDVIGKQEQVVKLSYASVAAAPPSGKPMGGTTTHSVIVSAEDELVTGEQVLEKIRTVVNAREEGVRIDNVRRAKDRKIIIGCGTKEEIGRVKERLGMEGTGLKVEEIKNKDPLVVVRDVLKYNTNEQVLEGLRVQNVRLFEGISKADDRMEVKFRKRARNNLTEHVVIKVSPRIWKSLTESGAVHIDLQKVRVEDQSPLIQCSRCLGYGHGKRFCRDPVDVCSHCGGPHLGSMCTARQEGLQPKCVNCVGAKYERVNHNAFSEDCPVRRRWDSLARATVQYC